MNALADSVQTTNYRVDLWSRGEGSPVLYLHGFDGPPVDTSSLEALAKGRQVVAPAHPGFAGSTEDPDIHEILNVVVFYEEFLDRLGLERIDVIGHSLGGMFAAELAAVAPRLVRRVVLVDPFGLWLDDHEIPDFIPMVGSSLTRLLWADPSNPAASRRAPLGDGPDAVLHANIGRTMNLSAAANYLWPIPDRGLRARIHRISAPTLIVWGASDGLMGRPYAEEWRRLIPGSTLEYIPGAGHFPMLEQPESFLAAVQPFLNG